MIFVLILFLVLLVAGFMLGELRWPSISIFLLIAGACFAAFIGLGWELLYYTIIVVFLDILLVLMIFKGNIQL